MCIRDSGLVEGVGRQQVISRHHHRNRGLLPQDGFAIDEQPGAAIQLNPSELALLQRLTRADLPRRRDGALMGPPAVWRRLLRVVEIWSRTHLNRPSKALAMLRETLLAGA